MVFFTGSVLIFICKSKILVPYFGRIILANVCTSSSMFSQSEQLFIEKEVAFARQGNE